MKTSKNVKRFLVIWTSFHLIALFVNLAGINYNTRKTVEEISHNSDYSVVWGCERIKKTYFLTSCSTKEFLNNTSEFWPFINFNTYESPSSGDVVWCINIFNGIFYKYDFTEFLLYSLLPFLIIFLRRLWA